jgi:hypothetical protein
MRNVNRPALSRLFFSAATVLLVLQELVPSTANAQITINGSTQGYNAVWSGSATISGSSVSLDASKFSGSDICAKITTALSAAIADGFAAGVVIDARGAATGICANSPTTNTDHATILLPAGTITLPGTWILGNQTRLIGLGRNQTTIVPKSTSFTGSSVIQMGSPSICPNTGCTGVVISELWVQGPMTGIALDGVDNPYAGEFSYLEHVTITNFNNNGLLIEGTVANNGVNTFLADGSGPYADLIISSVNATATSCLNLQAQTRGIHGLTCTSNGLTLAGLYLDGSGNTIEDIHFEGVADSILVGSQHVAAENTVINVTGVGGSGSVNTDVHISNALTGGTANVSDLTLMGISPYGVVKNFAVQDDLTGINLPKSDNVALYSLGDPFGGGYTLFGTSPTPSTTIPGLPTWGVGTTNLGTTETCNTPGSVYSNSSGTGSLTTVFVCTAALTWQPIV